MKPYLVILYLIACVVLGASADAYFDVGHKLLGHTLGAVEVVVLISGSFVFNLNRRKWIPFLLAYVFWRVVGYDYLYNLFSGLPWNYIGNTSFWDITIAKVLPSGLIWIRAVFLVAAVFVPIRELND